MAIPSSPFILYGSLFTPLYSLSKKHCTTSPYGHSPTRTSYSDTVRHPLLAKLLPYLIVWLPQLPHRPWWTGERLSQRRRRGPKNYNMTCLRISFHVIYSFWKYYRNNISSCNIYHCWFRKFNFRAFPWIPPYVVVFTVMDLKMPSIMSLDCPYALSFAMDLKCLLLGHNLDIIICTIHLKGLTYLPLGNLDINISTIRLKGFNTFTFRVLLGYRHMRWI